MQSVLHQNAAQATGCVQWSCRNALPLLGVLIDHAMAAIESELQQLVSSAASAPPPAVPVASYGWLSAQRLAWNAYRTRALRAPQPNPECAEVAHAVLTDLTRLCAALFPGAPPPPRLPPMIAPSLLSKLSPSVRSVLHHWLLILDARLSPLINGAQRL